MFCDGAFARHRISAPRADTGPTHSGAAPSAGRAQSAAKRKDDFT
ncbi:hypothetical protein XOC_1356 [Xanthomonas oryzae pv. oryzicola BLS256]|uniref:Uncharacterized protein n=2 Tax=Xanthomonas oryzae TaxID=347 RepID=A0A0K0GMR8_XANOP|nr:hypothetical protein PXO_05695 [Xanthomonas oryzae pv. oryzae PXO99A]AEQ95541.1 hypothetical protein XOC_1356 [Xanthomonas oryzae pv. oryzicola BLS256]QEO98576.1 hypothetical protein XOCgx_3587 [Xanthomonas oryzae pv. oryzicola]